MARARRRAHAPPDPPRPAIEERRGRCTSAPFEQLPRPCLLRRHRRGGPPAAVTPARFDSSSRRGGGGRAVAGRRLPASLSPPTTRSAVAAVRAVRWRSTTTSWPCLIEAGPARCAWPCDRRLAPLQHRRSSCSAPPLHTPPAQGGARRAERRPAGASPRYLRFSRHHEREGRCRERGRSSEGAGPPTPPPVRASPRPCLCSRGSAGEHCARAGDEGGET
jgi:hypothetical protein